jgi:ribosome-associated translation inhibitor RaiA
MQINSYAAGFELTPSLRALVESQLLEALRSFNAHVQSVAVHLATMIGRHETVRTSCEIVVSPRASSEIRVRTGDAQMPVSIDRAARAIRSAVELEASKPASASPPAAARTRADDAFELLLHENWISQHQREMLERPENYLRPLRIRQYSSAPPKEQNASSHESAYALVGRGNELVGRGTDE